MKQMTTSQRLLDNLKGCQDNYILPFFWQHGEDEEVLRHYMHAIHDANIGAVCVESRPHEGFLGPKWWADMDAILGEAKKLGMKVWILDDKHFPTGYAAGAMENAPAELCHQYMSHNTLTVCGPVPYAEVDIAAYAKPQPVPPWFPPMPKPKRVFNDDKLFRVLACPVEKGGTYGEAVDLTHLVKDGKLVWNVPDGSWKLEIIYLTRDARGRNDYINFLDMDSCRVLIDTVYEPHYHRYKEFFGNVIAGFFSDEPPIGNTPGYTGGDLIGKPDMDMSWSAAMPEAMEREYGPGWESQLALLWTQGSDALATARIRTAYMNAVSKLVEQCFSLQIGSWCEEHGVEYIGHMLEDCDSSGNLGPSMGHFFRGLAGQHMAGIDNIGGQVLPGGQHALRRAGSMCQDDAGFYHYLLGRMGASMAAIDPKKQGRCMCENFGAYGWQVGTRTEKYLMNHFLARGVNRYVPHAFTPKEFPDFDCPPHFYAHGHNPQYRAFTQLMDYANRICHLIDGGKAETPVAMLYHGESQWAGAYESNILAARHLTRSQYGFLLIPNDVFCGQYEYDKAAKTLTINGNVCRALVLCGSDFLPKAAAEFAVRALSDGFPVVVTGCWPIGISDATEEESAALVAALRKANLTPVQQLPATLEKLGIARTVCTQTAFEDLTAYRYENKEPVYLLLNESEQETFAQQVRLSGVSHVVGYDAWNNRLVPVNAAVDDNDLLVSLELAPLEMAVLICTDTAAEATGLQKLGLADAGISAEPASLKTLPLEQFTVRLASGKAYPAFAEAEEADLIHGMQRKYPDFSGYLRYETKVTLTGITEAALTLDNAFEAVEVFVNGVSMGMTTAQPYRFALSGLRDGENDIAIEVATTVERLAKKLHTDVNCMNPPAPFSPIGLVGVPVLSWREK